jgi:hypothetical protein
MILSKDDLLAIKPRVEKVELPAERGELFVREITGRQREIFLTKFGPDNEDKNMMTTVACWCICDADGKRFFEDSDLEKVGDLPAEVISAIYWKVSEISFTSVDEAEGNSEASQSD